MGNKVQRRMERKNRAKQFMPFDAVKGFREAMKEKEKIIVPKKELSEEQWETLNFKLNQIKIHDRITVEYYKAYEYVTVTGTVLDIDRNEKLIKMENGIIQVQDILDIQGNDFGEY